MTKIEISQEQYRYALSQLPGVIKYPLDTYSVPMGQGKIQKVEFSKTGKGKNSEWTMLNQYEVNAVLVAPAPYTLETPVPEPVDELTTEVSTED